MTPLPNKFVLTTSKNIPHSFDVNTFMDGNILNATTSPDLHASDHQLL